MKFSINFLLLIILITLISCGKSEDESMEEMEQLEITTTNDILNRITNEVVGTSTLVRREDGISMNFETTGLIPGHVYNIIWVIHNNPENCFDDPCSVTDLYFNESSLPVGYIALGKVASSSSENFSASLKVNDTSKETIASGMTSYGIREPLTADIHIALRSHGPAIQGQTQLQSTTYMGGCTTEFTLSGNNLEVPDEEGECATLQVSIHQAPE
jgi:hypothetical protein